MGRVLAVGLVPRHISAGRRVCGSGFKIGGVESSEQVPSPPPGDSVAKGSKEWVTSWKEIKGPEVGGGRVSSGWSDYSPISYHCPAQKL